MASLPRRPSARPRNLLSRMRKSPSRKLLLQRRRAPKRPQQSKTSQHLRPKPLLQRSNVVRRPLLSSRANLRLKPKPKYHQPRRRAANPLLLLSKMRVRPKQVHERSVVGQRKMQKDPPKSRQTSLQSPRKRLPRRPHLLLPMMEGRPLKLRLRLLMLSRSRQRQNVVARRGLLTTCDCLIIICLYKEQRGHLSPGVSKIGGMQLLPFHHISIVGCSTTWPGI